MLRACKYCGRIHDSKYNCGKRPVKKKKLTRVDFFRRSQKWTDKSLEIRTRDGYLCQACIRKLPGTFTQYNYDDLSVHHIIPANQDWGRKLDNDNLITLCGVHHKMAEDGEIDAEILMRIAKEQEERHPPGV